MNIPSTLRAGDTSIWSDDGFTTPDGRSISSDGWTLTYYLRTNTASGGVTLVGSADGEGWKTTLPSSTSEGMNAGVWFYQAVASKSSEKFTVREGKLEVTASLAYSDTPAAFDGRSQAQKDLDAVQTAIRSMIEGGAVQEYTIGNRSLKKMTIDALLVLESRLKFSVAKEKKAEKIANGLGNPHNLFIRFRG